MAHMWVRQTCASAGRTPDGCVFISRGSIFSAGKEQRPSTWGLRKRLKCGHEYKPHSTQEVLCEKSSCPPEQGRDITCPLPAWSHGLTYWWSHLCLIRPPVVLVGASGSGKGVGHYLRGYTAEDCGLRLANRLNCCLSLHARMKQSAT